VNRFFEAQRLIVLKPAYYRNDYIDSNKILHNTKDHFVLITGGPNTVPTKRRWRTAGILQKKINHHIPASALTDLDEIWHADAY